jgi:hypothetical protein
MKTCIHKVSWVNAQDSQNVATINCMSSGKEIDDGQMSCTHIMVYCSTIEVNSKFRLQVRTPGLHRSVLAIDFTIPNREISNCEGQGKEVC